MLVLGEEGLLAEGQEEAWDDDLGAAVCKEGGDDAAAVREDLVAGLGGIAGGAGGLEEPASLVYLDADDAGLLRRAGVVIGLPGVAIDEGAIGVAGGTVIDADGVIAIGDEGNIEKLVGDVVVASLGDDAGDDDVGHELRIGGDIIEDGLDSGGRGIDEADAFEFPDGGADAGAGVEGDAGFLIDALPAGIRAQRGRACRPREGRAGKKDQTEEG